MRVYFDTEFIEGLKQPTWLGCKIGQSIPTISLISLGLFREDGKQMEMLNAHADLDMAWNAQQADGTYWVRDNVLGKIYEQHIHGDMRNHLRFSLHTMRRLFNKFGFQPSDIAANFARFAGFHQNIGTGGMPLSWQRYGPQQAWYNEHPEFVAWYADYDWVVCCWLFGRMNDLPKAFPQYCHDLKQEVDRLGITSDEKRRLCPDWPSEHRALEDAKWAYQLDRHLECYRFHRRQNFDHAHSLQVAGSVVPVRAADHSLCWPGLSL